MIMELLWSYVCVILHGTKSLQSVLIKKDADCHLDKQDRSHAA